MNRLPRLLAILLVLILLIGIYLWWNQPKKVDMAGYVPADSMVYLELNSLTDVAGSLMNTDAWRQLSVYVGIESDQQKGRWLTEWARVTGIASTKSVIVARSQAALVLLEINPASSDTTLDLKPLAALVIETHTSSARIKPAIEQLLGDFARRNFGQPSVERVTNDQGDFLKWESPDGKRRIVLLIDGSTAIIGNDERAATACLAAHKGQRPSLAHQPDIEEIRGRVRASDALAFGYVSSANAARLLAALTPAIFGQVPEESQFQKLLAVSSAKVLGSIGWSSRPFVGGIEDFYFMSVKSVLIERLRPALKSTVQPQHHAWSLLPVDTYSVTNYDFADSSAAWLALNTAVSSQLDTLGAILFSTLSKASLAPYGIDEPETFLRAIKPEILTAKVEATSERSVVVAGIADQEALRKLVTRQFGPTPRTEHIGDRELIISVDERSAASFNNGYFMLGSPEDLRRCLSSANQTDASFASPVAATKYSTEAQDSPAVVTYTQDSERIRALLAAVARLRGPSSVLSVDVESQIKKLPYAVTETKLGDFGFERRTRSPLGQFSTLISLLSSDTKR
jgi:hypothetical protein